MLSDAMKKLLLLFALAFSAFAARAGDLWQWAPGHWSIEAN
jgi:hypothetical protein